jgi:hypothetical protein
MSTPFTLNWNILRLINIIEAVEFEVQNTTRPLPGGWRSDVREIFFAPGDIGHAGAARD